MGMLTWGVTLLMVGLLAWGAKRALGSGEEEAPERSLRWHELHKPYGHRYF